MEQVLLGERYQSSGWPGTPARCGLMERLRVQGKSGKKHCPRESSTRLSSAFVARGNIANTKARGSEVPFR